MSEAVNAHCAIAHAGRSRWQSPKVLDGFPLAVCCSVGIDGGLYEEKTLEKAVGLGVPTTRSVQIEW